MRAGRLQYMGAAVERHPIARLQLMDLGVYHLFGDAPGRPKSLTKEFLLVDLVNNVDQLAEERTRFSSAWPSALRTSELHAA